MKEQDFYENGFAEIDELCACKSNLILHAYRFKENTNNPIQKFYVECKNCGRISEWHESVAECLIDISKQEV